MEITYTNFHEKPLTVEQILTSSSYIKIFKENDNLKK